MRNMSEQLKSYLAEFDLAKLTSDLIKIKSYSFMEEQEKEVAEFIHQFFLDEGIESELTAMDYCRA